MIIDQSALVRIAAAARTLGERFDDAAVATAQPSEAAKPLLAHWAQIVAEGNPQVFQRRLAWDGVSEIEALAALTPDLVMPKMPAWTETLVDALRYCEAVRTEMHSGALAEADLLSSESQLFFPVLWLPFLRAASKRLRVRVSVIDQILSPESWAALQLQLLQSLCETAQRPCYQRFDQFRNANPVASLTADSESDRLVRQFIDGLLEQQLLPLLTDFPVLARYLCRLVDTWVVATAEILERLSHDRKTIGETFNAGKDPGIITAVCSGLSDRHDGGRQVLALTFETGLKLIYKPRGAPMVVAYNALLKWLADNGMVDPPPALTVLGDTEHVWIEFIEQGECHSEDLLEQYFRRAGALICLVYLLHGNDCHMENIIATAAGPVLIDVESLLQPEPPAHVQQATSASDPQGAAHNAMGSGLLCFNETGPNGENIDTSGLRCIGRYEKFHPKQVLEDADKDTVRFREERHWADGFKNLPESGEGYAVPEDYIDAVLSGFTSLYRFVLAHRQKLLADTGPLQAFRGATTRLIIRPTSDFVYFLRLLLTPEYLQNGLQASMAIEMLARNFVKAPERPKLWAIHSQEARELQDMDVPYFMMDAESDRPNVRDGSVAPGYFPCSGYCRLWQDLIDWSEVDLAQQLKLIREHLNSVSRPE